MEKLIAVPLKKPYDVDVIKPLTNLIQSAYSGQNSGEFKYNNIIDEFSKQRNNAIWKFFEKYESSLDVVYQYYDQLCALETKIPINELQIPFKWKDAFGKDNFFSSRQSLTHTSLAYEKVCILFNIAALQSSVATSQTFDSDEGLKLATKLFQQSAGIFQYLKGATPAAIPMEPTPDLNPDTLAVLSSLMIAQAQEVFINKAIKDQMKDVIIAKLCCQCEELYADVLRGMQKENLRSLWDKEWVPMIAGKQAGFHAMTQLYQSLVCRAEKRVGEEIARLQDAVKLFEAAQSRSGNASLFDEYAHRAKRNLTESKKDNDFIYNEMIPDVKTLPPPGKAQLAKALTIASPMSSSFKDLFTDLVPVVLHQALSASEARKNEIVNTEVMKLREATQTLNGILASLNLPAAIEITDSGSGLPSSLLEKSNDIRSKGGVESIQKLIKELPELLNRNREILDEAERMLNEEQESDAQLRNQFKEKWTRIPSEKLTEMFRSNAKKYREIINNAIEADKMVRKKFEQHVKGIELLSMSPEQIQHAVPSGSRDVNTNSVSVQRLRSLMEEVDTIKAERDVIESELKSATVNLKEQFLRALAQDGAINEPVLSVSEIGKALGPLQSQVQESISKQQELVKNIQESHAAFTSERGNTDGSRETLFSELAAAYDSFTELQNNLKEGTKFYNDLTQLLVVFQNKISDFCFARKTEKEELLKDLTTESSRQGPGSTPSLPSHYNSTNKTDSTNIPQTSTHQAPQAPQAPYPTQIQGMPLPYGATQVTPYPAYVPPPMPQGFNPYATLPYPSNAYNYPSYPQGPQPTQPQYGTYPGTYANQPGGGYVNQQKPPGW